MTLAGGSNSAALNGDPIIADNTLTTSGNIGFVAGLVVRGGYVYMALGYDNMILKHDIATGIQRRYVGTGNPVNVALNSPYGLAMDSSNSLYITDNQQCRVVKVTSAGVSSTYAGQFSSSGCSSPTLTGDGGPATSAKLVYPIDVATDASNNLYIADQGNFVVRKVTASGTISTVAGTLPSPANCPDANVITNGTSSSGSCIPSPYAVAVDPISGNLYFGTASTGNPGKVFKVVGGQFVVAAQVAEIPSTGLSASVVGLAFNSVGDLFFAVQGAVYKMPAGGALASVVRIAGDPNTGTLYSVSSGAALSVPFSPFRIAINPTDDRDVWISDSDNGLVWRLRG